MNEKLDRQKVYLAKIQYTKGVGEATAWKIIRFTDRLEIDCHKNSQVWSEKLLQEKIVSEKNISKIIEEKNL